MKEIVFLFCEGRKKRTPEHREPQSLEVVATYFSREKPTISALTVQPNMSGLTMKPIQLIPSACSW